MSKKNQSLTKNRFTRAVSERSRLWIIATAMVLIGIQSVPVAHATATYSKTITLPTPPATNFAGNSGGDGWDVSVTSDRIYNIFHHLDLTLACLNQADATPCWVPQMIEDDVGRSFYASNYSGADIVDGLLYTYATRNDLVAGVVCLDPSSPPGDMFCGFAPLTAPGDGWYDRQSLSAPVLVGSRYFAYNMASDGSTAGGKNKLLCYDFSKADACVDQPYDMDFGGSVPTGQNRALVAIDDKLLLHSSTLGVVACFDPATDTECAGNWPVSFTAADAGPALPMLDSAGDVIGACMPGALTCFAMDGSSIAAPFGFPSNMGGHYLTGGSVTIGPRVFTVRGNNGGTAFIDCYDYATAGVCNGFPQVLSGAVFPYTVNEDPSRPSCLWVNSDRGITPIRTVDSFSGGICGGEGLRLLISQLVVDQDQCYPSEYISFELLTPLPADYTGASIKFLDPTGGPTAIPDQPFVGGVMNLVGLGLENVPQLPQFMISLTDPPSDLTEISVKMTWESSPDDICVSDGVVPLNEAPIVSADAASVSVAEGTSAVVTGTSSDPDGDAVTLNADLGVLTDDGDGTWTWSSTSDDGPLGPYTVTVTATDGNGGTSNVSFDVEVTNVVPVVDAGADQTIDAGDTLVLNAGVTDPGSDADWVVDIDWGDGNTDQFSAASVGSISETHQYQTTGIYTVEICVTDKDQETDCSTMTVTSEAPPSSGPYATRTIGYWKTHPQALEAALNGGDINICGNVVTDFCSAYQLLNLRGGGASNFLRQATAAKLNCIASTDGEPWGCAPEIDDPTSGLLASCAITNANALDDYNNGEGIFADGTGSESIDGMLQPEGHQRADREAGKQCTGGSYTTDYLVP